MGLPSEERAVHSWPSTTAAPEALSLSTASVILAFFPMSPSTFVFTVFLLIYLTAKGLVKIRSTQETIKNTATCPYLSIPVKVRKNETSAPMANQIVQRFSVAASIPISITKAASHTTHSINSHSSLADLMNQVLTVCMS